MRKRRKGRIYVKDPTNGRLYGDFRDLNGKCEALKQDGRATTDWDVAGILVAKRVKELENEKRGIAIVGRGREETLESYALHHLDALSFLTLVCFAFFLVRERPEVQISFVFRQQIRVNPRLLPHLVIFHELGDRFRQLLGIQLLVAALYCKAAPSGRASSLGDSRETSPSPNR